MMTAGNGPSRGRRTPFLASSFLLLLASSLLPLASAGPCDAQTIWTGPRISFTRADGADPGLPENQDAVLPGVVVLTRGSNRGLYNAARESFFNQGTSPVDTEWAWPMNNPAVPDAQIRATNHAALAFDDWTTAHGQQPLETLNRPGVLHILSEDVYIDVTMTAWTSLASGGGFAYTRSTPPQPPAVPTLGALGQVLGTIGLALVMGHAFGGWRQPSGLAGPARGRGAAPADGDPSPIA